VLIGFARNSPLRGERDDKPVLQKAGCDRIYSAPEGVLYFTQVFDYLRSGDVAVVTDLGRLGNDLETILDVLNRLHAEGIGLHVVGSSIVPGTAVGDSLSEIAALLAPYCAARVEGAVPKGRRRGRPPVLVSDTRLRIAKLLKSERVSVPEIARMLGVSAATIYRNFPRSSRPRGADPPEPAARSGGEKPTSKPQHR
jgi:DNA invertase Pin-like site-specific DNA recombinase